MYVVNRKTKIKKKRRWLKRAAWLLLIVAVGAGIFWFFTRQTFQTSGSLTSSQPTVFQDDAKIHITEPLYGFDLPADWKELKRQTVPYRVVTWKGTGRESDARTIDVYTDAIPPKVPLNRIVPVSGEGNQLAVDTVSDNCLSLSPDTAKLSLNEATYTPARLIAWQGVQFLCDIPNSLRNVIGASSTEGLNRVALTGQKGGTHRYFFVYTDHTAHPDTKTFTDMLISFRAL